MKVLIGYERFGVLREAFRAAGHDAYSCDIAPAADGSPFHLHCDVRDVLHPRFEWDLAIFHPDCTYLTNSAAWAFADADYVRYPGVGYHQKIAPDTLVGAARREARQKSVEEVLMLWNCQRFIRKIAIENPRGYLSTAWRKPDQILQPNRFGDDASKATCLWLFNLRKLRPTKWAPPRRETLPLFGGDGSAPRWSNQTDSGQNNLSPGERPGDGEGKDLPRHCKRNGFTMERRRMTNRYKQPHLDECSRDYLVGLAAELEEQKADGNAINQAFLDKVYAAIPTAPASFVLHAIDR